MLLNFLHEKALPHFVYICSMTLRCSSDNTTLLIVLKYVSPSLLEQQSLFPLGTTSCSYGFKYYLYANDAQTCISVPDWYLSSRQLFPTSHLVYLLGWRMAISNIYILKQNSWFSSHTYFSHRHLLTYSAPDLGFFLDYYLSSFISNLCQTGLQNKQ